MAAGQHARPGTSSLARARAWACPACGEALFGWLEVQPRLGRGEAHPVLLQRCERCALGIAAELAQGDAAGVLLGSAREGPGGRLELRVANRRSIQASLGGAHWAALKPARRLYPTPQSLRLLAESAGLRIEALRCPRWGRGQAWMWQTILNAFTLSENFVLEARSGTSRLTGARGRLVFTIDALVTALAALPVAIISVPLELFAALRGRGGEIVAIATRAQG